MLCAARPSLGIVDPPAMGPPLGRRPWLHVPSHARHPDLPLADRAAAMDSGRRSTRIPLPPVAGAAPAAPPAIVEPAALPVNTSVPANLAGKPGPVIAVHRRNSSPTFSDVSCSASYGSLIRYHGCHLGSGLHCRHHRRTLTPQQTGAHAERANCSGSLKCSGRRRWAAGLQSKRFSESIVLISRH